MVLCVFWVRWGERGTFLTGSLHRRGGLSNRLQEGRKLGSYRGPVAELWHADSDSQTHLSFRPVSHVHRGQLDDDTWWERGCRSRREAIAARRERGWEPELSGGCWDGLEEKKVEDWQINTDICWGLIGGGERGRSVTTVKSCSLFHDELHFLLGPPGMW